MAFNEDTCLEKKRVRSKVTQKKVGVGLKRRREFNKKRWGWRLVWWGFTKKESSHLLGLKKRHQYSDQRSRRIKVAGVASTAAGIEREVDQMARSLALREQLTEESRETGGLLTKREKSTGPRIDPGGTPRRT